MCSSLNVEEFACIGKIRPASVRGRRTVLHGCRPAPRAGCWSVAPGCDLFSHEVGTSSNSFSRAIASALAESMARFWAISRGRSVATRGTWRGEASGSVDCFEPGFGDGGVERSPGTTALFGLGARLSGESLQLADAVATSFRALLDQRIHVRGRAFCCPALRCPLLQSDRAIGFQSRELAASRFDAKFGDEEPDRGSFALAVSRSARVASYFAAGRDDGLKCFELLAGALDRVVGLGEVLEVG